MSASWLQDRLKKAEELLHAVDRTAAKAVSTEISTRKPDDGEGLLAASTSTAAPAASLPSRAKSTYQRDASKGAAAAAVAAALAAAEQAASRQVPAATTAAEPAHALVDARSDPVALTPTAAPAADGGVQVAPVAGTEAAASVGQQTEQPLSGVGGDAAAQHAAASSGSSTVGPSSSPASQQHGQQHSSTPKTGGEAPPKTDGEALAGPAPPPPADSTDVEAVQTAAEASPAARGASNGQGVESVDVQQASEQAETGSGEPSLLPTDSTEASSAGDVQGGSAATAAQREARLLKMVDQLKRRMERYKAENEQLEEMLKHADAAAHGGSGEISRLEDKLARAQAALISAEAATAQALAAKATELMGLRQQLDAAATRAELAEQRLEELQAANEQFVEERKASEGQLLQTLRQEVESIERRLDEERAAHTATRKASAAREQQQDATLAETSSSLAAMQRTVEQRSAKLSAAEERCYALEHEVDGLVQQLRAAEAKLKRQLEAAAASSSEVLQQRIGDLEEQLRSAQIGQQQAEQARARADEELVVLRAEVSTVKRQLADAHSVDSSDLQRRLKDVTDMLYLKQTQLERLAADKAAQQLAMERELQQAKTESQQVKRRATMERSLSAVDESMVPMDTLGDAYTRLANNNRVGGAVKAGAEFIDQTANQFVRILRQYPLGRLVIFCYILGLHLFIYILLHRLQHKAFKAEMAAEAAHRDDRI